MKDKRLVVRTLPGLEAEQCRLRGLVVQFQFPGIRYLHKCLIFTIYSVRIAREKIRNQWTWLLCARMISARTAIVQIHSAGCDLLTPSLHKETSGYHTKRQKEMLRASLKSLAHGSHSVGTKCLRISSSLSSQIPGSAAPLRDRGQNGRDDILAQH